MFNDDYDDENEDEEHEEKQEQDDMANDNEEVGSSLGRIHSHNISQFSDPSTSRRLAITNQQDVGEPLSTQTTKCHKSQPK